MVPPTWVEVIYVIPLYGVSQGLNLNLSSVGGRSLRLTNYYRAEARRYLPDRAKTEAETVRQSRGRGRGSKDYTLFQFVSQCSAVLETCNTILLNF